MSYGVTVDNHQLNQVMTPVVSAIPDMVSLVATQLLTYQQAKGEGMMPNKGSHIPT